MTTVETIGRIRRSYFVQRQSVREIARRLHVSRKTVRKAIEAEVALGGANGGAERGIPAVVEGGGGETT